jgi:integrase
VGHPEQPTHSAKTAKNKFIQIVSFLKRVGSVPMVGAGKCARPLGMKDAPRCVEKPVSTYTPEELARFFLACDDRETTIFQTLNRTGLREQELSTLRRQDCQLDGPAPCPEVVERQEYGFVPKWYAIRDVSIDPELASILKGWISTHKHALVFPTPKGQEAHPAALPESGSQSGNGPG